MIHSTNSKNEVNCSGQPNKLLRKVNTAFLSVLMIIASVGFAYADSDATNDECQLVCAPDVSVSCGQEEDLSITGVPTVIFPDGYESSVDFSHSDQIVSSSACSKLISRVWTVVSCDQTFSCTQLVTVQDTSAPIISGVAANVTVECVEDLPQPAAATAIDGCSGNVPVTVFQSNTGQVVQVCTLTTAFGPGPDWALWLPDLFTQGTAASANYSFVGPGTLEQYNDGTAHLFGLVANNNNSNQRFQLSLWFKSKRNWNDWSALGRSYKDDLNCATPSSLYELWTYYEMVDNFSTATGQGVFSGIELYFQHMPANLYFGFQIGDGANNKNCNYGGSVWFTYTGFNGATPISGHGDVNVDASCVPGPNRDCPNDNEFTYVYRAADACGRQSLLTQVVTVNDQTAPTFDNCPSDVVLECGQEIPAVVLPTATDNCTGDVTVSLATETVTGDDCERVITRVFEARDLCGNRSSCTYTITIRDTTEPTFTNTPAAEITAECNEVPAPAEVSASDGCSGLASLVPSESIEEGNCPGNYDITRTWVATDSCGNAATFTQIVHVRDTRGPVFDAYDVQISRACNDLEGIVLTAQDACGTATVSIFSEVLNSGACLGVIHRVYKATDECGNSTTADLYITLIDTVAPTFNNLPTEATIECADVTVGDDGNRFGNGGVTASDNCEQEVSLSYREVVVATDDNCPNSYDVLRIWTAEDLCENVAVDTVIFHVVDTQGPIFEFVPADITINCDEQVPFVNATANDLCGSASVSHIDERVDGSCPHTYIIVRTFKAIDDCGNVTERVQNIVVRDVEAPIFEESDNNFTYECGSEIPLIQPVANDNCGEVSYSHVDGEVMNFEEASANCHKYFLRTWTATDECNNSAEFVQTIQIVDTTAPVFAEFESEIERPCSDYEGIFVQASDVCNDVTITYTDLFVSGGCQGRIARTYVATDACGNSDSTYQYITLIDTTRPTADEPQDFQVNCDDEWSFSAVQFSDNCDEQLEISQRDSTNTEGCTVEHIRIWTAVDNCGNVTVIDQKITEVDVEGPIFTLAPADTTVNCDDELPIAYAEVMDLCHTASYSSTDERIDGPCAHTYTIKRIYRAFDSCGNPSIHVQFINVVDNEGPVFGENQAEFTYECGATVPVIQPSAEDACGTVTYGYEDGAMQQSNEENNCENFFLRTWTATDECNNSTTFIQTIRIVDTTAPVFDAYEMQISKPCDNYQGVFVTATDACNEFNITYTDIVNSGGCQGNVMRTYTAKDACGNERRTVQYILLLDATAPTASADPADFEVSCTQEWSFAEVSFSDNCDDSLAVSVVDSMYTDGCVKEYFRAWTAEDNCGNITSVDQKVTVVDHINPYFTFVPEGYEANCDETLVYAEAAGSDACSSVSIIIDVDTVFYNCAQSYDIVREFIITDACGNDTSAMQIIAVRDLDAPVYAQGQVTEYTYECSETIPVIEPQAADNCSSFGQTYEDSDRLPNSTSIAGYNGEGIYLDLTAYSGPVTLTLTTTQESGIFHFVNIPGVANIAENAGVITYTVMGGRVYGPCTAPNGTLYIGNETPVGGINLVIVEEGGDDWNDMVLTVDQGFFARLDDSSNTTDICGEHFFRTWTATDACGNVSRFVQRIDVVDTTSPVVTQFSSQIDRPCGDYQGNFITAEDACHEVIITYTDEFFSGTCQGRIVRTYTVKDICGNVNNGQFIQIISLIDTLAPEVVAEPEDVNLECTTQTVIPSFTPEFTDNCDDNGIDVVFSADTITEGCTTTITRRWTATDNCENSILVDQVITITDTQAPYFVSTPDDLSVSCDQEIVYENASAFDACDGQVPVSVDVDTIAGNCVNSYTIVRLFTARDACGFESTYAQHIYVTDTTNPTFTYIPQGGIVNCEQVIEEVAQATDNCGTATVSVSVATEPYSSTGSSVEDCGQFTTYTMGGWGNTNSPQANYRNQNFASAFPSGLSVGCGNNKFVFTSAAAIQDFLPAGGQPAAITNGTSTNPTSGNVLAGQLTAAKLSVGFDAWDEDFSEASTAASALIYANGPFAGLSLGAVIAKADSVLGGCLASNMNLRSSLVEALTLFNENYDEGDQDNGNFECNQTQVLCGKRITYTWTATDLCGNDTTATTVYIVFDNVAPTFDQQLPVEPVRVQCADDVPAFINLTATDNCGTAIVDRTEEVLESDSCGNKVIEVRYVAYDECNNIARAFYRIIVEDTQDPQFDTTVEDIVLSCDQPIPAAEEITATDNCSAVTVDMTETVIGGELPTGAARACQLITPDITEAGNCQSFHNGLDWAIWLGGNPNGHKEFRLVGGQLYTMNDGSLWLNAQFENTASPSFGGFNADIRFSSGLSWSQWSTQSFPTSFKADCGGLDANFASWTYHLLQSTPGAELVGYGLYAGSAFSLEHAPLTKYFGFQLGDGANNLTPGEGFGGWFAYSGSLIFDNNAVFTANMAGGDIALNLDCCPRTVVHRCWTATDCSGNTTEMCQTIRYENSGDSTQPGFVENNEVEKGNTLSTGQLQVAVFPNPAVEQTAIVFSAMENGKSTIEIFDLAGARVAVIFNNEVIAGKQYRTNLDVTPMAAGVYMYTVTNGSTREMGRFVVNK